MSGRTLYSGGTVLTLTGRPADAVLVEDGRIVGDRKTKAGAA